MMSAEFVKSGWPTRYEARVLPGLPAYGPEPLRFQAVPHQRGREGLVLEVRWDARQWIGNFQRGDGKLNAIYATPSGDTVCVVAGGRGYWVATPNPQQYELVMAYPIQDVRAIIELELLIFADYTALVAYGTSGLRWKSRRVSWDGIRILRVDEQGVVGRAWDATKDQEVDFFVDAATGRLEGGAAPPD
jgi:hypothetical protein